MEEQENAPAVDNPECETAKRKFSTEEFSFQDYVTFGYLYLLTMGILTEVVYYKLLGINILYYSSLLDVLLSPLSFMVRRLPILFSMIACVVCIAIIDRFQRRQIRLGKGDPKKVAFQQEYFFPVISAIAVFFMFIGGGLGAGVSQSKRLEKGEFENDHAIEFVEGPTVEVRVFGQNTDFIFYAVPGQTELTAAPVRGNIRRIDKLSKDEQQDKPEQQD